MARQDDWRSSGACLSSDPDLFFPISSSAAFAAQIDAAKLVCARCRVSDQCLSFALSAGNQHGIWGGTTEEERIQIRRSGRDAASRMASRPAA